MYCYLSFSSFSFHCLLFVISYYWLLLVIDCKLLFIFWLFIARYLIILLFISY